MRREVRVKGDLRRGLRRHGLEPDRRGAPKSGSVDAAVCGEPSRQRASSIGAGARVGQESPDQGAEGSRFCPRLAGFPPAPASWPLGCRSHHNDYYKYLLWTTLNEHGASGGPDRGHGAEGGVGRPGDPAGRAGTFSVRLPAGFWCGRGHERRAARENGGDGGVIWRRAERF